jgi:hypothetical protein
MVFLNTTTSAGKQLLVFRSLTCLFVYGVFRFSMQPGAAAVWIVLAQCSEKCAAALAEFSSTMCVLLHVLQCHASHAHVMLASHCHAWLLLHHGPSWV